MSSATSQSPSYHCDKQPHHHHHHHHAEICLAPGMIITHDNNNGNNNSQPRQMGSVSFSMTTRIRKVLHVDDYSESERQACWYTEQERIQLKEDRKRHIKRALWSLHRRRAQDGRPATTSLTPPRDDGHDDIVKTPRPTGMDDNNDEDSNDGGVVVAIDVLDDVVECCDRGLEHYLDGCQYDLSPKERYRATLANVRRIVVQAQRIDHDSDGSYDDDDDIDEDGSGDNWMESSYQLAQQYKEACYESKVAAYLRGVQDARVAKELASISST